MSVPKAFTDLEAVKLAEGMERDGLDFYRAADAAVEAGELKSTFAMLAGEELKHLATFEDMAGELARSKTEEYWDQPDVDAYIRAVVCEKVFPRPDLAAGTAAGMSSAADALRFALQAEKDTVLFYSLCAEGARGQEVREAFGRLIAEERKHVALVGRLLREAAQGS
jgi:rubrerythrin